MASALEEEGCGQAVLGTRRGPWSASVCEAKYKQIGGVILPMPLKRGMAAAVGAMLVFAAIVVLHPQSAIGSNTSGAMQLWGSQEDQQKEEEEKPVPFSPLLLCFAMVRTTGYEPELLSAQFYNKAGIFACDKHKVFSTGGIAHVGSIRATEVVAPTSTMGDFEKEGTTTDSWLNTMTFIKAWDLLIEDGTWWTNDWTVKVDPDAVFFPDRLRMKVAPHTGGLNAQPLWVGNCDRVWHRSHPHLKLFGSLEVLSRNAVGTYKAFGKSCQESLPWHGWGEDMFMQNCMQMLKVKAINGTDYLGDKRCYDAPCTDTDKVAFHDFKAVEPFFQCWGQSRGSERVQKEEKERLKRLAEEARLESEQKLKMAKSKSKQLRKQVNQSKARPQSSSDEKSITDEGDFELLVRK